MLIRRLIIAVLAVSNFRAAQAADTAMSFRVTFDRTVSAKPFTGRVFVMLSRRKSREPRAGISWLKPEPVFYQDVEGWKPGTPLVLDSRSQAFPEPWEKLTPGMWTVQAVMDFNRGDRHFSNAPGNGYSKPVRKMLSPTTSGVIPLLIDQKVKSRSIPEHDHLKSVEIQSKRLTAFHKQPVMMQAGVVLPDSYLKEPDRRYPVIYEIPGFGGSHLGAVTAFRRKSTNVAGTEFLYVVLNPNCRWGHHVFADSANNGPWGAALIHELIPAIEKKYRAIGKPTARYVTGHSSGGWSSLWLQVTYPDFFGGCWSTSPDPVDFRDFQRVNIYKPENNLFVDAAGKRRPLGRRGSTPVMFYKPFSDMETVMGHGGQLGSFEAVFSPRGKDGKPALLWDRKTGAIDLKVAKSWEKYDIRLVMERNWKDMAPRVSGKIHLYMGGLDTYYLDGATRLLKASLAKLGSDAVVEIFPKRSHSIRDKALRARIAKEMAAHFKASHR